MVQRVQTLRTSVKNTRPAAGSREPGELYVSFPDLQIGVIDAAKVPKDLVGVRFFSATTNYAAGDFVIEAGVAYRANTSIVAGAFNASQWDTVSTSVDLTGKENTILPGTTAQYWRGDKSWQALNKAAVGLDQVDNTSDANKPVSIAQATADASKVTKAGDTMTGHLGLPASPGPSQAVRRDYVDVADGVLQSNINLKADLNSPAFTGNPTAPTPTAGDADTSIATTAYVTSAVTAATGGFLGDAPNDGQSYGRKNLGWVDVTEEAPSDDISYGRKNGAWIPSVGGAVISDTPPPGPLTPGQLWWESDTGDTYIWVDDGTSQQWVQQNIQPATTPDPLAGQTALARNRIVNGAMQISQETGAAVVTGGYPVDQFQLLSPIATVGASKQPATLQFTSTLATSLATGKPALATGDYWQIIQPIEGTRIADFRWGNANAKPVIVRFWAYSNQAGTYSFFIKNHTPDRIFAAPFTLAATTWTEIVIAVPGDTTGTWLADTSLAMRMVWGLAAGTSQGQCVAGWSSTNGVQIIGHTNLAQTANNGFYVTNVGLYLDPDNTGLPPKWEMPDEAEELRACQRYWEKNEGGTVALRWFGNTTTGFGYQTAMAFKVSKRVDPTVTAFHATGLNFPAAAGTITGNVGGILESRSSNVTGSGSNYASNWIANARM
jgi:hypothetical protein